MIAHLGTVMQLVIRVRDDACAGFDAFFDLKIPIDPLARNLDYLGLAIFNDIDFAVFDAGFWNSQLILSYGSLDRLPIHKVVAAQIGINLIVRVIALLIGRWYGCQIADRRVCLLAGC